MKRMVGRGRATRRSHALVSLLAAAFLVAAAPSAGAPDRSGGMVRIAQRSVDVDSLDPALSYSVASGTLVELTCARLLGAPWHSSGVLKPEVATGLPTVSGDGRTYTFTLKRTFRFSDGTRVGPSAFVRAIERMLDPAMKSPWGAYMSEIVGAEDVLSGKTTVVRGVAVRRDTLAITLRRRAPDFPVRVASFLCAVPPALPADPEGYAVIPAAGPYYVSDYRAGERVVLHRNPFYGGSRPQRVDGFRVDLRAASPEEVLDRIERGEADWGWVLAPYYFDPARRLAARYGVNRARFFVQPGSTLRGYALNVSRPLFRNNPKLRQAVNFAIDRAALRLAGSGPLESRLTDQYLPPTVAGFEDARIYPLAGPDLARARALAKGHTRSGRAVFYTVDSPQLLAFAQSIKRNLAEIGLDVQIKGVPMPALFGRLGASGPYDIGFAPWVPDYNDPYAVLNIRFDGRFKGAYNWSRLDSPTFNRLLRDASRLHGAARLRAYARLDERLAREGAPLVAVDVLNDPVLVSARVGCVTKPFDLGAICLR